MGGWDTCLPGPTTARSSARRSLTAGPTAAAQLKMCLPSGPSKLRTTHTPGLSHAAGLRGSGRVPAGPRLRKRDGRALLGAEGPAGGGGIPRSPTQGSPAPTADGWQRGRGVGGDPPGPDGARRVEPGWPPCRATALRPRHLFPSGRDPASLAGRRAGRGGRFVSRRRDGWRGTRCSPVPALFVVKTLFRA